MTDPDDLTDKAHLYRGLSDMPSAHNDPPASVAGPSGLREHPDAAPAPMQQIQPPREELSYDTVRPRTRRGGGTKLLLGAAAVIGAALAYFLLPKFGFGPGSGHGGTSPGDGGASPTPPAIMQATQPATSPGAPAVAGVPTTIPVMPLHLTIVNEGYRIGSADGKEVTLDDAVSLAKTAKPGSPVFIDLVDSSRASAEEELRKRFDQQQIPILWTRDGKPVTVDLPGPGKISTPGDSGGASGGK